MRDEGGGMNKKASHHFIHHPSYFILSNLERATRFELATLSLEG
jgi:hypothetical protein